MFRSVIARFFQWLPYRGDLSLEFLGDWHGLSARRLFVLIALCEAEISDAASIRALARDLPLDFPIPRIRSMQHSRRLNPALLGLRERGLLHRVERNGIVCFEPIARVHDALTEPDESETT